MPSAIFEALSRLLQLLVKAFEEYDRRRREKASQDRQEKADAAKSDIVGAFNDHFGGVRNDSGNGGDSGQAGQANGTDHPGTQA